MPLLNRRNFIKSAAATAALGSSLGQRVMAKSNQRPNVLFIMADDLGYGDLSCFGRPDFETPVIDKLARDGLKLDRTYANSAVCSPTRTALLTGRYQYRIPIGLEEPLSRAKVGMPPTHPTMASQFKAAGYQTALVGKWHLGFAPDYGPLKSGYDNFFGFYPGGVDYFAHKIQHGKTIFGKRDPSKDGLWDDTQPVKVEGYLTDVFGDKTVDMIGELAADDKPFFISLHFSAPHWPWEGPDDIRRSRDLTNIMDTDGGNEKVYGEMVKSLDANVGRVLAELEKQGIAENTIVVFTSDNGGERFSYNWPFVGAKGELLEGGIRVPGIVRWPQGIKPNTESHQVITSMDWMPTLLAAAGGKADADYPLDGMNLLPVLQGQHKAVPRKLFWRYKANEQMAVLDGEWKYLSIGGHEYLFNVVVDKRERANLKDVHPDIFARLKQDYAAWNATMLPYPEGSYSHDAKHIYSDRY